MNTGSDQKNEDSWVYVKKSHVFFDIHRARRVHKQQLETQVKLIENQIKEKRRLNEALKKQLEEEHA